ncbi:MAG: c-type cytochrome [Rhodoplanes sp.]|uniref:c-type cytochrome n=1 Tax=Rhodoplanes sp. TaxID=1968906 RepID=UPI00185400A1|nr:cytochrome c [Rhodoplanes sp.]NVO12402.1 c-type cytochrome [Rhodoplanes sp.]
MQRAIETIALESPTGGQPRAASMLVAVVIAATAACPGPGRAETLLERGSYLVNTILACANCHTPKTADGRAVEEKELAGGGLSFTTPAFNVTASNITPDPETGIGAWSDDDIKQALTAGARPAHARLPGAPLAAVMPAGFYKALLPRDLDAIVAYLRTVKPVRNAVRVPEYKAPVHRDAYPDAEAGFSEDSLRDPVKRGAYLVTIGHCMECHSAWARGISDYATGLGKGGRKFGPDLVQGFAADWQGSTAPNITSHTSKGIGGRSDADIKRAMTQGLGWDGRVLKPPMGYAWYAGLHEEDVQAIVAWLRTVPPAE